MATTDQGTQQVAIVLVRGMAKTRHNVRATLAHLRLSRVNQCVVLKDSEALRGMLRQVKDNVTWGTLDDATFKELVTKRGREFLARSTDAKGKYTYNKFIEIDGKKYHKTFCLNPPRKGYGRAGVKTPFTMNGALGNRNEKINDLLQRMI